LVVEDNLLAVEVVLAFLDELLQLALDIEFVHIIKILIRYLLQLQIIGITGLGRLPGQFLVLGAVGGIGIEQ
jgi:hypothetical protein